MMTAQTKVSRTTALVVNGDGDGVEDARAWAARQLRFEHMLRRLERRAGVAGDETASGQRGV